MTVAWVMLILFNFHDHFAGASSDFQSASRIATAMVTKLGMSDKVVIVNYSIQNKC